MRKTDQFTIDGITVRVRQHGVRAQARLRTRILKMLGPSLAGLLPLLVTGEADIIEIMQVDLQPLVDNLDPAAVDSLYVEALAESIAVVGEGDQKKQLEITRDSIDEIFDGNLYAYDRAFLFALVVNYRDFTKRLAEDGKQKMAERRAAAAETAEADAG